MKPNPNESKVADKQSYAKVLALLDVESGLSDWEVNFAESVVKQLEAGNLLTATQRNKLEEILLRTEEEGPTTGDHE